MKKALLFILISCFAICAYSQSPKLNQTVWSIEQTDPNGINIKLKKMDWAKHKKNNMPNYYFIEFDKNDKYKRANNCFAEHGNYHIEDDKIMFKVGIGEMAGDCNVPGELEGLYKINMINNEIILTLIERESTETTTINNEDESDVAEISEAAEAAELATEQIKQQSAPKPKKKPIKKTNKK